MTCPKGEREEEGVGGEGRERGRQAPEEPVPAQEEGAEEGQVVQYREVKVAADPEQVLLEHRDAWLGRLLEDPLETFEEARETSPLHRE